MKKKLSYFTRALRHNHDREDVTCLVSWLHKLRSHWNGTNVRRMKTRVQAEEYRDNGNQYMHQDRIASYHSGGLGSVPTGILCFCISIIRLNGGVIFEMFRNIRPNEFYVFNVYFPSITIKIKLSSSLIYFVCLPRLKSVL